MSKTKTDLFWNERPKTQVDANKVNIDDLVQRDLEKEFIEKHLKENNEILEVGCGNGYFTSYLRQKVKWVDSFDYAENMVLQAKSIYHEKNNKFFHDNLLQPKNITKKYDVVICVRVLINLQDFSQQKLALKNLLSWVKPSGTLLLIEGFREGFEKLNQLRLDTQIQPLLPAPINFYCGKEEFLGCIPENVSIVDHFHTGTFDFLTRVVYPALMGAENAKGPSDFHEKIREIPKNFNPTCMEPFARLHGWAFINN